MVVGAFSITRAAYTVKVGGGICSPLFSPLFLYIDQICTLASFKQSIYLLKLATQGCQAKSSCGREGDAHLLL